MSKQRFFPVRLNPDNVHDVTLQPVSEEEYFALYRPVWRRQKQMQKSGQCLCRQKYLWKCDGQCDLCEFSAAGTELSLDFTTENEEGDVCSPLDSLADLSPSIEDVACDRDELDQLFERLNELMPEAVQIGKLRQKGLTDEAIAEVIGIKRTTFLSRLKVAQKKLAAEFPDRF